MSSALVLVTLHRLDHIPAGMTAAYATGAAGSSLLAALAVLREYRAALVWPLTAAMLLTLLLSAAALLYLGRRHEWLPSRSAWQALRNRLPLMRHVEVPHV